MSSSSIPIAPPMISIPPAPPMTQSRPTPYRTAPPPAPVISTPPPAPYSPPIDHLISDMDIFLPSLIPHHSSLRDSLLQHVACSICLAVVISPVETECGHLACSSCLKEWNSLQKKQMKARFCPTCRTRMDDIPLPLNRTVRRIVSEYEVKCVYENNGCDYKGIWGMDGESLKIHMHRCEYKEKGKMDGKESGKMENDEKEKENGKEKWSDQEFSSSTPSLPPTAPPLPPANISPSNPNVGGNQLPAPFGSFMSVPPPPRRFTSNSQRNIHTETPRITPPVLLSTFCADKMSSNSMTSLSSPSSFPSSFSSIGNQNSMRRIPDNDFRNLNHNDEVNRHDNDTEDSNNYYEYDHFHHDHSEDSEVEGKSTLSSASSSSDSLSVLSSNDSQDGWQDISTTVSSSLSSSPLLVRQSSPPSPPSPGEDVCTSFKSVKKSMPEYYHPQSQDCFPPYPPVPISTHKSRSPLPPLSPPLSPSSSFLPPNIIPPFKPSLVAKKDAKSALAEGRREAAENIMRMLSRRISALQQEEGEEGM